MGEAKSTYAAVLTVAGEPEQRQDVTVRPGGEAMSDGELHRPPGGDGDLDGGNPRADGGVRRTAVTTGEDPV
ncbi:hypothetical protein ROS62_16280 [Streptomyces sp. DSM 41972]|uniref:Uncharacterized protein n=1 Tax=Streptomyces althioticus subsp. attaecolombicae TaxID=3075534 RepID=A0ABU3I088_9ACTN|nr:hypothetical protein [Streptomyces sp. DSM 41972]